MTATEPIPPANAGKLYKTLFATAIELVHCQDRDEAQPTRMNLDRMRAVRTPNHTHSFGHNHMISIMPKLQGVRTTEEFVDHVNKMIPRMEDWKARVTDIVVDETKKMCIVRGSYYMKPMGAREAVENDIIWWLWMDESGQKVEKAIEFLDTAATAKIAELIMAAQE